MVLSSDRQPSFDTAAFHGVLGCWPVAAQATVCAVAPTDGESGGAQVTLHAAIDTYTGEAVVLDDAQCSAVQAWLHGFMQAAVDFAPLQAEWCERDPPLQAAVDNFPGMRILQQDVWECLLCFLCSSNNNIPRIRQMLSALRSKYGHPFSQEGGGVHPECAHSMPCITALANAPEADLRALGLGYRAKFIQGSAQRLLDAAWRGAALPTAQAQAQLQADADNGIKPPRKKRARAADVPVAAAGVAAGASAPVVPAAAADAAGPAGTEGAVTSAPTTEVQLPPTPQYTKEDEAAARAFLQSLRGHPADVVQAVLVQLPGVGRKVADCVGLFSCDATGALPVDTHVWKIAQRELDPSLADAKSITPRIYRKVGGLFRDKYGAHAGWAHSWLFAREIAK